MNEDLRKSVKESLSKYSDSEYTDEQIDNYFGLAFYDMANVTGQEILVDNLTDEEKAAAIQGAYALGLRHTFIEKAKESAEFGEKDFSLDITPELKSLIDGYNEQVDKFNELLEELKKKKRVVKIERK